MKKILISMLLIFTLILESSSIAFATQPVPLTLNDTNLTVLQLSDSRYLLSDGTSSAEVSFETNNIHDTFKVSVKQNRKTEYFLGDLKKHTLYSSITGKTIDFTDEIIDIHQLDSSVITKGYIGEVIKKTTTKISYAKLADGVSNINDIYSHAAFIISVIGIVTGVPVATAVAEVVSALQGAIFDKILQNIKKHGTKHGVKMTVTVYRYTKHQGGAMVKGYHAGATNFSTY